MKTRDLLWKGRRRTFVTADTHFGDTVALRKFSRPFGSVDAADKALVAAINARVGRQDILLHVGDLFGDCEWTRSERLKAKRLRDAILCRRIVLVSGNTDPVGERWFDAMLHESHQILSWRGWPGEERTRVVACHYPMRQWQGWPSGALHLYGHVHGTLAEQDRSTDVGVDCWNYAPLDLARLLTTLKRRPFACPKTWPRQQPSSEPI
ncbi:MAG: metallophosphoesterase [Phycisphaerae bacterium]|nr:metallophosphoesterase [Phycisphaerae bacterium]